MEFVNIYQISVCMLCQLCVRLLFWFVLSYGIVWLSNAVCIWQQFAPAKPC